MKCMVIAVLAVVGLAQAVPFGLGVGLGDEDLDDGIGAGIGAGIGGDIGGGLGEGIGEGYHAGGAGYGHSGYAGGRRGYHGNSYGQGILKANHNIGHHVNDYSQEVHHHSVSDHNIGGVLQGGSHGRGYGGYGSFGRRNQGYGNRFNRGGYTM